MFRWTFRVAKMLRGGVAYQFNTPNLFREPFPCTENASRKIVWWPPRSMFSHFALELVRKPAAKHLLGPEMLRGTAAEHLYGPENVTWKWGETSVCPVKHNFLGMTSFQHRNSKNMSLASPKQTIL
jgi:hypothetical protein